LKGARLAASATTVATEASFADWRMPSYPQARNRTSVPEAYHRSAANGQVFK